MGLARRIAVVGGGIIGMSTALELRKAGCDVTLFEQNSLAGSVSWAANGALTPYSDHNSSSTVTKLAEQGVQRYVDHVEWLTVTTGLPIDLDAGGVLEVFLGEEGEKSEARFLELGQAGYPVALLDGNDARKLEGALSTQTTAAIHYMEETRIDTRQLLRASIKALDLLGVNVRCPSRVLRVDPSRSYSYVTVTLPDNAEEFDAAVLCTGYGRCEVAGMPQIPLHRVRGELIEVMPATPLASRCLYRGDSFITPRRDGRLLLGTNYDFHEDGMDENTNSVSVGGAITKMTAAISIVPEIARAEILNTWKSWRPTTYDNRPVIGCYGSPNLLVALGLGGLGITLAPAIAAALAAAIAGESAATAFAELHDLRPERPGLF